MDGLSHDFRYGFRMLLKRPGLTAAAILALALGIGANTAIFSVVNGVLLRPLPYADPDRLVMIWDDFTKQDLLHISVSAPEFMDYKARMKSFSNCAAYTSGQVNLTGAGEAQQVRATAATAGFFETLGVPPALGRSFTEDEDRPGNETVVVLSDGLWKRSFGGDPSIVGRSIMIDGRAHTVVGVARNGFTYPDQTELWAPIAFGPDNLSANQRGSRYLQVIGRLGPEATLESASAELSALTAAMREENPNNYLPTSGWTAHITRLEDEIVGNIRPALLMLTAAVGFVLLIVCANVANIMLVRVSSRSREIAIRSALGAGRGRIARQFVAESVLLALIGGGLGLVAAMWGVDVLMALSADDIPRATEVGLDWRVLAFAGGLSLATGILFGLAPALRFSSTGQAEALKEGGRGGGEGLSGSRVRGALVGVEVALALVLLVGSGLFVRSLANLWAVDAGFRPENVLTLLVSLPNETYSEDERVQQFYQTALERIGTLPGVQSAGMTSLLPLDGNSSGTITVEKYQQAADEPNIEADTRVVSPDYFRAMGIDLVEGRSFTTSDRKDTDPVAIVDEALARKYFPEGRAIGNRLKVGGKQSTLPWLTVVGVSRHVLNTALDDAGRVQIYMAYDQFPYRRAGRTMSLAVRSEADPVALGRSVQSTVRSIDMDIPVASIRTMEEVVGGSIASRRLAMVLLAIFAFVALALAVVGLGGVMSYSVTQRTHEIGVRLALGARPADVVRLVVAQGMLFALAGVALGMLLTFVLMSVVSGLLFGVSPTDPATYLGMASLLVGVALVATLLPARRAARVDPMIALRYE
jgi:putative ABC transport system permease protein